MLTQRFIPPQLAETGVAFCMKGPAMKRLTFQFGCLLVLGLVVVVSRAQKDSPDQAARAAAVKLFNSLSEEQKKSALLPVDDKDRNTEAFPAVVRKGIEFKQLKPEQVAMVDELVQAMTSEYGATRCAAVGKQTGPDRRYLTFFGTPSMDGAFAYRVASHHLTLVYAQFGKANTTEFGPVLLGGNPVKDLWEAEDKLAVELFNSLSEKEAAAIKGKGNSGSGAAIGENGIVIGELSDKPKELARKLLAQRLAVFSTDRRKALQELIDKDGGVDKLRVAFWGNAAMSHLKGGNYNWKIGSPSFICDWQTAGAQHIHMTLRYRGKS